MDDPIAYMRALNETKAAEEREETNRRLAALNPIKRLIDNFSETKFKHPTRYHESFGTANAVLRGRGVQTNLTIALGSYWSLTLTVSFYDADEVGVDEADKPLYTMTRLIQTYDSESTQLLLDVQDLPYIIDKILNELAPYLSDGKKEVFS